MLEFPPTGSTCASTPSRSPAAMREAMASAEVGDDVFGEDPTVIKLQERMASIMGKEAGLLVPSGTMSNAVAIRSHTQPGDEIVTEEQSHLYVYEGGGYAALSGCSVALVPAGEGSWNRGRSRTGSQTIPVLEPLSQRQRGLHREYFQSGRTLPAAVSMKSPRWRVAPVRSPVDGPDLQCGRGQRRGSGRVVRDCDTVSICISKGLGPPPGRAGWFSRLIERLTAGGKCSGVG